MPFGIETDPKISFFSFTLKHQFQYIDMLDFAFCIRSRNIQLYSLLISTQQAILFYL